MIPESSLSFFICHVEEALLFVEGTDSIHFLIAKRKVECADILVDIFGIINARNDGEPFLNMPANYDLCRCLTMCFGNAADDRIHQ